MSSSQGVWGPRSLGYVAHSLALRHGPSTSISLACGSFEVEAPNFVEVLTADLANLGGLDDVRSVARLPHYFPPTSVQWLSPDAGGPDLLVTSGDYLRIWNAAQGGQLCRLMRHESNPDDRCTPITSVAAAADVGAQLASCDVYGICAFWDTERGAMQQAVDLGQPLFDVAYGPDGLVAVAGERGECFLVDPRQPESVEVITVAENVSGPARVAWSPGQRGLLSIAWQGKEGGVAVYSAQQRRKGPGVLLPGSRGASPVADLQWSPAFHDFLCCASEDGSVVLRDLSQRASAGSIVPDSGPLFSWEPRGGVESCTALALSGEVQPGQHAVVLATATRRGAAEDGQATEAIAGSLWMAALPQPPRRVAGLGAEAPAPPAWRARGDAPASLRGEAPVSIGAVSQRLLGSTC